MRKKLLQHLKHDLAAFNFSMQGLKVALSTETPFIHEAIVLALLPLAARLAGIPWGMVLLVMAGWLLVMTVELLNMAIEKICDLVSPDFNPLVKIAKDVGSAAVFLAILANALFWFYLIYVYIIAN
jgi:diacylglycerol kinase (ATP)